LAQFAQCGVTAIQDALRRLRALGLVTWTQQFVIRDGQRRQTANAYRITMPTESTRPRPDLRRHRGGLHRPKEVSIEGRGCAPARTLMEHRQAAELRILVAWQARRGTDQIRRQMSRHL
jgi:hypothetical protein